MPRRLLDVARVIRSKNAGPFELTFDIMFKDQPAYDAVKASGGVSPGAMARLYGIPEPDVLGIVWFAPARAVKITIRRPRASGAFGETDIYGAQQHAPLLTMTY